MKILVTGSAGFIGFHLCRRLLGEGHQLAGVDSLVPYYDPRLKEKRHALLIETNRFRPHIVDISDMAAIRAVIEAEAPEVIIHLAAQPGVRYGLEHPEGYVSANVIGSFNLLEICRHRPVQHFLMASTSSVYGANSKMPFQETDPTDYPALHLCRDQAQRRGDRPFLCPSLEPADHGLPLLHGLWTLGPAGHGLLQIHRRDPEGRAHRRA